MRNGKFYFSAILGLTQLMGIGALSGCSKDVVLSIDPALGCGPQLEDRFKQVSQNVDKIDILFVMDTSSSQFPEAGLVADEIDNFVNALTEAPDYRIGVMLAHAGASNFSGRLYSSGAPGEQLVLSPAQSISEIQTQLRNKLTDVEFDNETPTIENYYLGTDQGEASFYSLKESITNPARLAEIQAGNSFYRADAAQAVVFIADENDVCVPNPAGTDLDYQFIEAVNPFTLALENRRLEEWAYINWCSGITPLSTFNMLKDFKADKPLLVGGVIYNNINNIPPGAENSLGYGYLDIIDYANGGSIDMNSSQSAIAQGLAELGQQANFKLVLKTEFPLLTGNVAPKSIEVRVNGQVVPHSYQAELNEIQLLGQHAGQDGSDITVTYKQKCE